MFVQFWDIEVHEAVQDVEVHLEVPELACEHLHHPLFEELAQELEADLLFLVVKLEDAGEIVHALAIGGGIRVGEGYRPQYPCEGLVVEVLSLREGANHIHPDYILDILG